MKALVTGGTGFLGGRIAQLLAERGDDVTVTIRDPRRVHPHPAVRTVVADITNPGSFSDAFCGIDVVFHTAARTGVWGPRRAFWNANVVGTRNVIEACLTDCVARLVYTSTPSVVFDHGDLCGVDESQPYSRRFLCAYAESKARAEEQVLAANDGGLATVALRPHLLFGPGDPHLLPRVMERARSGRLRQVGDGENVVDLTYVDNAAQAHLDAADRLAPASPCGGKAYFISNGEPVKLWPWLHSLLARLRLPAIRTRISLRTAYAAGALLEAVYRLTRVGHEPPMTRFVALQLAKSHYFEISAARRDLGYTPRVSMAEGLSRWLSHSSAPGCAANKSARNAAAR
jgi:nucleoside-diphosphate-sugar epimerase